MASYKVCAGGCGKALAISTTLSSARPICRECRRGNLHFCLQCGRGFRPVRRTWRYCSHKCSALGRVAMKKAAA